VTTGRVLVLGGARSGKSAFAESLLGGVPTVDYVATSMPTVLPSTDTPLSTDTGLSPDTGRSSDTEWTARVARHQARRPASWRTVETCDLPSVYDVEGGCPVLLDSVTAWLTDLLDETGAWTQRTGWRAATDLGLEAMLASWSATARTVVAVSDEVGGGIVPQTASGRLFRDELGLLNQRLAAGAEAVWLVTAGIAQRLR
jgi:adenosylcobinamide kinase/adenosylcobinamide-phosphate guanylyltransferase